MQRFERESRRRHERLRQTILAEGRPDLVAALDDRMRKIALGLDGAGRTWQALSAAQRRVLTVMATGRKLIRRDGSRTRYRASGDPGDDEAIGDICGLPTVRNLCARELCHVDGGALDPERVFVLTERGAFVAKHGPLQPRI